MQGSNSFILQEVSRVAALHAYGILDTLPEESFDDLAILAAQICQTPIGQVSFVDQDRQWIKATTGLPAAVTARVNSFCAHTIPTATQLIVPDATQDARFRENPLVCGAPHMRAYAGSPITDDKQHVLGTICVIDTAPRGFSREQIAALDALSRQAMLLLKQRKLLLEQQKAADENLLASKRSLANTAEMLALSQAAGRLASWEWNLATNAFRWSGGSEWVYGRPEDDLSSLETIMSYIHPEDVPRIMKALEPALGGRGDYRLEFRVFWPDGSQHWLQAFGKPVLSPTGIVERIVGLNMDITERKSAEERLLQSEKVATVGRLSSVIAHELNNPLACVANLLFLAQGCGSLEQSHELLGLARTELERASTIANETLRFNKQSARRQDVLLPTMIDGVLSLLRSRIHHSGITLERRDRVQETLSCFESEIRQVLSNLISNALDAFSRQPRRLFIRTRSGTDWRTCSKGQVLTVADTADGMSKLTLSHLFDAFFTTKELSGTGLGLWLSREVVDKHGGHIRVRSRQSDGRSGTVFTVFLPA